MSGGRKRAMLGRAAMWVAAVACAAGIVAASGALASRAAAAGNEADAPQAEPQAPQADSEPTWDRPASIRGAAERLAFLHRTKGAKAAYTLIENCYKTHSLAETYGEGFETCIAQDYLETRTLMLVYSRMPPETLQKMGVPSPQQLADSMAVRITSAFHQYHKDQAYADELKRLVDQYGVPVFLSLVFPEAARPADQNQKQLQEKQKPQ